MATNKESTIRDDGEPFLSGIINTLTMDGRLNALVAHGIIEQQELDKLNELEGKEKTKAINALNRKVKHMRNLWEGQQFPL